jgi:hypothetical protein
MPPPAAAANLQFLESWTIIRVSKSRGFAGVVQWQNGSFPSCIRGFDSLRPLQISGTEIVAPSLRIEANSMRDIKESDWKVFKRVREVALERFCERVLDEVARINSDATKSKHERYVAIYRLVRERDKEINSIFDFLRRSSAFRQILAFRLHDLISEQELSQFSPELAESIKKSHEIYTRPMEFVDEDDLAEEDTADQHRE